MALPPLVLLVDDLADHREMYAEFLSFSGLRVAEAGSGETALVQAERLRPEVIVMDLGLPRMDGSETVRRLRSDPRTRSIPVIVLSGRDSREDRDRAADAGCDLYLVKPCLPDDLVRHVRELLGRTR
jgi:CheY-like chemotaxis protein